MTNYYTWPYNSINLPTNATERAVVLKQYEEKFRADLAGNPTVQSWLARYNPDSIANFIDNYIGLKMDIVTYTQSHVHLVESEPQLQYRQETDAALNWILQKKLFNLQCLWRAEAITLPGVHIAHDFVFWEKDIRNCPFIEPVTVEELQLMQHFAATDDMNINEDLYWLYGWQDYDDIMELGANGHLHNMPEWYQYYDMYMGTGNLLLLPNIRGEKEARYIQAYHEEKKQKTASEQVGQPPAPQYKTSLSYNMPLFYELANHFDDEHFVEILKVRMDKEKQVREIEGDEIGVDDYVRLLKNIPNLPPVRGGLPWREAIRRCYTDYVNTVIRQDLPVVWDEYEMYRSTGLQTAPPANDRQEKYRYGMLAMLQEWILAGRATLGEPKDFNF